METTDVLALVHPTIAVTVVFPLIGVAVYFAWQTRQRRLKTATGDKSTLPPTVGREHVKIGKKLTGAVLGVCLLGIAYPTFAKAIEKQAFSKNLTEMVFLVLMFAATLASLVFLYRAVPRLWRFVFAGLTSLGVLVLGFQDIILGRQEAWIFRRDYEWQVSHFYYGMVVTLLMIVSLAIVQEIYQDRSNRWRNLHIVLNCIAILFFMGQGMTGTRDLLEIPLSWQKPFIYQCDFNNKTCPTPANPS
jgi:drug/metabolite transporter (DMT)-like permease